MKETISDNVYFISVNLTITDKYWERDLECLTYYFKGLYNDSTDS